MANCNGNKCSRTEKRTVYSWRTNMFIHSTDVLRSTNQSQTLNRTQMWLCKCVSVPSSYSFHTHGIEENNCFLLIMWCLVIDCNPPVIMSLHSSPWGFAICGITEAIREEIWASRTSLIKHFIQFTMMIQTFGETINEALKKADWGRCFFWPLTFSTWNFCF